MKQFNQQFATQHLREEFDPNVSFTISDPEVDRVYDNLISLGKIENLAPAEADYITLSDRDWNILQLTVPDDSIVQKKGIEFIDSVHMIDEQGSVTGGGEAFLPGLDVPAKKYKAGYTKKVEEKDVEPKLAAGKAKIYMKNKWGWKDAPSIPNRPSKGGFIYKQLFEELSKVVNEIQGKMHIGTDLKTDSDIYFEPSTGAFYINIIDPAGNRTNKLQVNTIEDVLAKFKNWKWTEAGKAEFSDALNENYSKFKNETKTRGKSDQFHQAVRQVKKRVQEINKLFEYVSRLKEELSEGEDGLKYKMHTEKALEKIKEMVSALNQNIKKFK